MNRRLYPSKKEQEQNNTLAENTEEYKLEPDTILNATTFVENPIEEKPISDKKGAQLKREQEKKYKAFVSSVDDIKKFSNGIARIMLNVNGRIKDTRKHLAAKEALSISEPSYRLFDRNVLSRVNDMLPDIEDENKRDIKEILTALTSWGIRCAMVAIADWTAQTEEKTAQAKLNTARMQDEMRLRQEQAHREHQERMKEPDESYTGGTISKDSSLNLISIDPNQLDPITIGAMNDGSYGL